MYMLSDGLILADLVQRERLAAAHDPHRAAVREARRARRSLVERIRAFAGAATAAAAAAPADC